MRLFHALGLLLCSAHLSCLLALELPTSLASGARTELDGVLRAAHVEFPQLTEAATVQASARMLIIAAEAARVAIAHHVVQSQPLSSVASAVDRAVKLQDELMQRVESHLRMQLEQVDSVHEQEWKIYRGLLDGLTESQDASFIHRHLRQYLSRQEDNDVSIAKSTTTRDKIRELWTRIQAWMQTHGHLIRIREWRVWHLLAKMSSEPEAIRVAAQPIVSSPRTSAQLRAKLSSITALESAQTLAASAKSRDSIAAELIDNAPALQSDLKIRSGRNKAASLMAAVSRAIT